MISYYGTQTTDIPECICNTTHSVSPTDGLCQALIHIERDTGEDIPNNRHERRAAIAKKRKSKIKGFRHNA